MSYHNRVITKGVLGERSKILEEISEWEDSVEQGCKIMELVELSDLLGAIEFYVKKEYNLTIDDLMKMNHITQRAFTRGRR